MMTPIERAPTGPTVLAPALRKVMIVGRQPNQRVLETLAEAGDYDVVIVESTARAYSHIKRAVPNLVVLCLDVDDPAGCQLLSMLNLDNATSWIPVVTYALASDTPEDDENSDGIVISMN